MRPIGLVALAFVPLVAVDFYFYEVNNWSFPLFTYVSYIVYLMAGWCVLRKSELPPLIGAVAICGSVQFFLITNFGVWLEHAFHPECYTQEPFQYAELGGPVGLLRERAPLLSGNVSVRYYFHGRPFWGTCCINAYVVPGGEAESCKRYGEPNCVSSRVMTERGSLLLGSPNSYIHLLDLSVKCAALIEYTSDLAKTDEVRPLHRQYLRSLLESGQLFCAGPFADDIPGALIVYEAESIEKAEQLLKADPFHANGVFVKWQIRPWKVVMGNPALMPA